MTAELFEEVARNTTRLPKMEALDIPFKLIWGATDPSQYRRGRGLPVSPEPPFPPCAARRALGPDRCAGASRKADAHRRVARPGRRVDGGRVDQDIPPRRRSIGLGAGSRRDGAGFPEGYIMSDERMLVRLIVERN
jgi:hypothetical protein